ncbi:MAG: hypothetical protein P8X42_06015 [Calditrichaceae bacterium]
MSKYLIELEHDATREACEKAIKILLSTGSHFLTNAEWGCEDGEHKCWITVDAENKEEARLILPPLYRKQAKITKLNRYSLEGFNSAIANEQY